MRLFPKTISIPPEFTAPLAEAVGGVMLMWGSAEASLNICVVAAFRMAGGKVHATNGELPVALKRKLDFLRVCFRKLDPLAEFKKRGLAICTQTGAVAKYRNTLAHSYVSEFDPKTQRFTFTGLGSDKDVPLITGQAKLSIDDILKVRASCVGLAIETTHFAHELVGSLVG